MSQVGYSTQEAAALTGLTTAVVRQSAREGLVSRALGPDRRYQFSFRDLIILRSIKSLRDAHVPARRIRETLKLIQQNLPDNRDLSQVQIRTLGKDLVIRDDQGASIDASTGQRIFDFSVSALAADAVVVIRDKHQQQAASSQDVTAEAWYELGLECDAVGDHEAAEGAFTKALRIHPRHVGSLRQLGWIRLHHEQYRQSIEYLSLAQTIAPDANTAFNLGEAFHAIGNSKQAVAKYREAIRLDPTDPAPHISLSQLYEEAGRTADAIRELSTARRLETRRPPTH